MQSQASNVAVVLNRTNFLAGDLIEGVVVVHLDSQLDVDSLVVKIKGIETAEWDQTQQRCTSIDCSGP